MFVVYYIENMRDGIEEGAKIMPSLESALNFISNARNNWYAGCNHKFKLFELGKAIPIVEKKIEEKQERIANKYVFEVAKDGN